MLINRRNAMMAGKRLPYDAEVEYLESTGTQWIETNYYIGSKLEIECVVKPTTVGSECDIISNQDTSTGRFVLGLAKSSNIYFGFAYSRSPSTSEGNSVVNFQPDELLNINCVYDTTLDTKRLRVNNVNGDTEPCKNISNTNKKVRVFGGILATSYALVYPFYGQLYSLRLVKDGVLWCDLIPVRFTNELGQTEGVMYDRLGVGGMNPDGSARTDGLYRNRGTGAFLYGNDLKYPIPAE